MIGSGKGNGHVLALSGGVGGAKLAAGLAAVLPPERLTIAVNTAAITTAGTKKEETMSANR